MSNFILRATIFAATAVAADKLGDLEQGTEFTKCINETDFVTKSLHDDITLIDKDSESGCCPEGTVPGARYIESYQGAQVVCGFTDDGISSPTESTSNGVKSCTHHKCYVMKQHITCADGSMQRLNGCCGSEYQPTDVEATEEFQEGCLANTQAAYWGWAHFCLTRKDYTMLGTSETTDDQADGKLVVDSLYTYTPCSCSLTDATCAVATSEEAAVEVESSHAAVLPTVSRMAFGVLVMGVAWLI